MTEEWLSSEEAARRLGLSRTTLYDWLGRSRHGLLVIRGQQVVIEYFQGGAQGQGRIQIKATEVERLRELMRVHPQMAIDRRRPIVPQQYPGITVPLGRPQ